jgi:hypothetical protein
MTRSLESEIKLMRRAILAALMALIILLINAIATMKAPAQEKRFIEDAAKVDSDRR